MGKCKLRPDKKMRFFTNTYSLNWSKLILAITNKTVE